MSLIVYKDSKYTEYEKVLLERDQKEKEASQIWTAYTALFGQLIADVYEQKIECIKKKKTISYYQNALNHGDAIDPEAMNLWLQQVMAEYNTQLKRLLEEHELCKNSKTVSAYEAKRSKELYRRIAKLVHPDLNPETDRTVELQELWQRVCIAYAANDIKELSELEVLVRKTLQENGIETKAVDIPDIEEKIAAVRQEIKEITQNDPYLLKYILEDDDAVEAKTNELQEELEKYKQYCSELDKVIVAFLNSGELKLECQIN